MFKSYIYLFIFLTIESCSHDYLLQKTGSVNFETKKSHQRLIEQVSQYLVNKEIYFITVKYLDKELVLNKIENEMLSLAGKKILPPNVNS